MNILFMCVANSARSQLAEGLAKRMFGPDIKIESAGSMPSKINPFAVAALKELGVDAGRQFSKSTNDLSPRFLVGLAYVITLCAEEVCPTMVSRAKKLHWPLPDPAGKSGSEEEQLNRFRETRDAIVTKLKAFAADEGIKIVEA